MHLAKCLGIAVDMQKFPTTISQELLHTNVPLLLQDVEDLTRKKCEL